jgi:ankyrin repeat protein
MKKLIFISVIFFSIQTISAHVDLKGNNRAQANGRFLKAFSLISAHNIDALKNLIQRLAQKKIKLTTLNAYHEKLGIALIHKALIDTENNYNIIELLLQQGAEPNKVINKDLSYADFEHTTFIQGSTEAHVAILTHKPRELLQLLYRYGCDFSNERRDIDGNSPFDLAEKNKNFVAIEFLKDMKELDAKQKQRRPESSVSIMEEQRGACKEAVLKTGDMPSNYFAESMGSENNCDEPLVGIVDTNYDDEEEYCSRPCLNICPGWRYLKTLFCIICCNKKYKTQ